MPEVQIEQALYGGQGAGGYRFLARSPGFVEDWLPEAERICTAFGERPAGVACPGGVFAQPFGRRQAAIVQVADLGQDDRGRPGVLGFHLLILSRKDYDGLGGDPFLIADRCRAPWHARGELPPLSLPKAASSRRTVEQVQGVLKPPESSPFLLGAAQALVDGCRLVLERPEPATELLRQLWLLLPWTTRSGLWPASFAFSNALGFDVVVLPRLAADELAGYLMEQQASEYPEGHYELTLQIAAEAGDQRELDALFARRSRQESWKLGLLLLALTVVLVGVGNWFLPAARPARQIAKPAAFLNLPASENYPPLSDQGRQRLTQALQSLANRLDVRASPQPATAEVLLAAIAERLGTPDPQRDPGTSLTSGHLERRLRSLLWKEGVAGYANPALNPVELVERLESKVSKKGSRD